MQRSRRTSKVSLFQAGGLRTAAISLAVIAAALILAGCPANALKIYLTRATGFEGEVYVSTSTGHDANRGTAAEPLATIQAGIELGQWYLAQGMASAVSVRVAEGAYEQDSSAGVGVYMVEGVSLYGGYAANFSGDRDSAAHETIILDRGTTGNLSENGAAAVWATDGITNATVLDGFTIIGGTCETGLARAVHIQKASPTIRNNTIDAGNGNTAVDVYLDANPVIDGNTIRGATNDYGWKCALAITFNSLAEVRNNTIDGGENGTCVGVLFYETRGYEFQGNTVTGGNGAVSCAIEVAADSNVILSDNTITAGVATSGPPVGIKVHGDSRAEIAANSITAPFGVHVQDTGSFTNIHGNTITSAYADGEAKGITVADGANADIYLNSITCGPAGSWAVGILASNPAASLTLTVEANTVSCTNPGGEYTGIRVENGGGLYVGSNVVSCNEAERGGALQIFGAGYSAIIANTFFAEDITIDSTGIEFHNASGRMENNIVNPGSVSAGESNGIVLSEQTGGDVTLLNNTVASGTSSDGSRAIRIRDSSPVIDNNLIIVSMAEFFAIELHDTEDPAPTGIKALRHNLFYRENPDMELYQYDGDWYNDIESLEAALNLQQQPDPQTYGNLDSDDAGVPEFLSLRGDDEDINTMSDNDWHLVAPTAAAIYEGGRTAYTEDAVDRDGTPRTDPWSIGAYEYDGD